MKGLFGPQGTDCKEVQGGFRNGQQRWRCQLGRKGSYFNLESYHESAFAYGGEAGLQGWNPFDMQRFSDSEIGTRMIKGPLCRNCDISISLKRGFNRALCFGIGDSHTFARRYAPSNVVLCLSRPLTPASLLRGAMLHGASNRQFFIPEISNTELKTVSGFCPESLERVSDARRKKEP